MYAQIDEYSQPLLALLCASRKNVQYKKVDKKLIYSCLKVFCDGFELLVLFPVTSL